MSLPAILNNRYAALALATGAIVLASYLYAGTVLAGASLSLSSSSTETSIYDCGVYESFGALGGTPSCGSFSCTQATAGQSCISAYQVGYVPAGPVTCSFGICTGGVAQTTCQVNTYTCTYTPPACTPDSSCAANTYVGSTCTDSCGNVYNGTKQNTVNCADVGNVGNPACINFNFTCAQFGQLGTWPYCTNPSCTSSPNSCGMTGTGELSWGVCSAVTPSNSLCTPTYSEASYAPVYSQSYYQSSYAPAYSEASYYAEGSYAPSCTSPTVSITANPSRVKSGQTSTLTVTASGITGTCTVTGPGVSRTFSASSCNVSGTITTPAITQRSTYSVTCDGGTATAKVIVNMPFGILEF